MPEQPNKTPLCVGILAHVDAGKTTLAEALMYTAGGSRKLGRVDHGDTLLDTHDLEKERGITIFASQAQLSTENRAVTLLDTPGHVDFSCETERTLGVLDAAILVISGTDGVQSHTRTLWRLLELYNVPTFIFVTKMDFARLPKEQLLAELQAELSPGCLDLFDPDFDNEALAMLDEEVMEKYLGGEEFADSDLARLVAQRKLFPCCFGSGLKVEGIDALLDCLSRFSPAPAYPETFGARVYKITHDQNGARVAHVKVTGGTLKVRDTVTVDGEARKVSALRVYSGHKFTPVDEMPAGGVCAVLGLGDLQNGAGLGREADGLAPVLEPVMTYRVLPPEGLDPKLLLPKLRQLQAEDPQLKLTWNEQLQEIQVGLMGEVQAEILKSLIAQRFGADVTIDSGRVMYKETIDDTVEGVGHYEPLRHYAEVHLLMEPLERGSGLVFASRCGEDHLDRNWQRLILTHLAEKAHLGVLTGAPITDMKITLAAGRAHLKHTEGGDFRQATYRAVRQGLMQAKSVLLEPWYAFRLEVPTQQVGRAMRDIKLRAGEFDLPSESGALTLLTGRAPVSTMNDYAAEVASYTGGVGRLSLSLWGYDTCHNAEEVIAAAAYNPESDLANTPDSVFCAHGGGFNVKWNEVPRHMHLESCLKPEAAPVPLNHRAVHIDEKELAAILARTVGTSKRTLYRPPAASSESHESRDYSTALRTEHYIVDGYNVIFAWPELKRIAETDLDGARERLTNLLCNFSAYHKCETLLVFDAYRVSGGTAREYDYHNIKVAFTKENETGDTYIERRLAKMDKNSRVRVVTSDWLIQVSAVRAGVMRMSAAEFIKKVSDTNLEIDNYLKDHTPAISTSLGDKLSSLEKQ